MLVAAMVMSLVRVVVCSMLMCFVVVLMSVVMVMVVLVSVVGTACQQICTNGKKKDYLFFHCYYDFMYAPRYIPWAYRFLLL